MKEPLAMDEISADAATALAMYLQAAVNMQRDVILLGKRAQLRNWIHNAIWKIGCAANKLHGGR